MLKKSPAPPEDDGRVVAPMNVEGMPWYVEKGPEGPEGSPSPHPDRMTPAQGRAYTAGVLKAAFLVIGVFVAVYLLFILFCLNVWFV